MSKANKELLLLAQKRTEALRAKQQKEEAKLDAAALKRRNRLVSANQTPQEN